MIYSSSNFYQLKMLKSLNCWQQLFKVDPAQLHLSRHSIAQRPGANLARLIYRKLDCGKILLELYTVCQCLPSGSSHQEFALSGVTNVLDCGFDYAPILVHLPQPFYQVYAQPTNKGRPLTAFGKVSVCLKLRTLQYKGTNSV